jgi:hypothetical protein
VAVLQLDEVDESRAQYRQQVTDVTEQRGKLERDLLFAKQEAEKCYMAAIGRCVFTPRGREITHSHVSTGFWERCPVFLTSLTNCAGPMRRGSLNPKP